MKLRDRFLNLDNFWQAWEEIEDNDGCSGVDGETILQFSRYEAQALQQLYKAIAKGQYRPLPLRQLFIPKAKGGWRELGVPTIRDRIVQQALLQVLHPLMEQEFAPSSFAYRPGRSHLMAVEAVARWHDRGYEWVLDADIVKYFDRIAHARLLAEVQERINQPWLLALIEAWVKAGKLTKAGLVLPQRGVPQGAVISPLLSNIYLDDFDELLQQQGLKLVRYADDFVVMTRTRQQAIEAREDVAEWLESMGLELHPEKTRITNFDKGFRFLGHTFAKDLIVPVQKTHRRLGAATRNPTSDLRLIHTAPLTQPTTMQLALVEALKTEGKPIPPPLFVVLGYKVREKVPVAIESEEIVWRNGMSSLYVVQQGTILAKEQGRFILKPPKEEELEVPIREVERILVFGNVQLSTAVISTCLNLHIPVVFLSQLGEYKGHLWSAETADFNAELAQFQKLNDETFQLRMAKAIVWGKLMNSKQLLIRLNRKRELAEVAQAIEGIIEDINALEKVENLNVLRGYEGIAAARYFPAFGQLLLNPDFQFRERNRRPPKDPINSLLSFGYTLLFNNVMSLILTEGLNSYLGNLHRSDQKAPQLVLDLMEEFRSPIVDSLTITLVNRKMIRPTDFTWPNQEGGVYLVETARRLFLKHFEERMSSKIKHPDLQEQVSYRRAIHLQVQRYKKSLLQDTPYEAFLRTV